MNTSEDSICHLLEAQYVEICKAHTAITDFRGKLLALFPVAGAGGLFLAIGKSAIDLRWVLPVSVFAFAVTAGLFVYELRQIKECIALARQAALIEDRLGVPAGLRQFRDSPPLSLGVVGVEWGSWVLYVTLLVGWFWLAGEGYVALTGAHNSPGGFWWQWLAVGVGTVVVVAKAVQICRRDRPRGEQVAQALNLRGIALGQLGRPREALDAYQQVIDDYRDDPSPRHHRGRGGPALREQVAKAMLNRGITLGQLDRPREALDAYQQVIDDYRDDPSPALREQVAKAMLNRGITLGQLDRPREALDAYQQVIDDYRDNPVLREQVELATDALYELRGTGGPP